MLTITSIPPNLSQASAISLVAGFVFEPVQDPGPREDRVFEDQGLFAEQVFLSYAGDGFGLQAGKFNPHSAWHGIVRPGFTAPILLKITS